MTPDIATAREASNFVKAIWPAVKKLFNWRKRFENQIGVDVASYAGAVRVDTMNKSPAIEVMLKVYNFSPLFRRKVENITASLVFKKGNDWGNIIQNETIVVAKNLPRSGFTLISCRFKLTDSQIRSLDKYHSDSIIEVRVNIQALISSLLFSINKYMPDIDVLVRPWPKGTISLENG
jgi:hypothetical protein